MTSPLRTAGLVVAAVTVIGCGAAKDGAAPTAAKTKGTSFSACMRDHGVRDFPDPDASGELTIDGVLNGSSLDPETPEWKRAIQACRKLQPAGFTGRKRTPTQQKQGLAFAACVRRNGVADFPDPAPGEPLVNTNLIPSTNQPGGMTVLDAAMAACKDVSPVKAGQ